MEVRQRNKPNRTSEKSETHNEDAVQPSLWHKRSCLKLCCCYGLVIWLCMICFGYFWSPFIADEMVIEAVALDGAFATNTELSQGVRVHNLPGPECIVEDNDGNLYTGLANGKIVRVRPHPNGSFEGAKIEDLTDGSIEQLTPITKKFPNARPSGLRLLGNTLYVVDCVYGLYSVNVQDSTLTALVDANDISPPLKFPNDLDISADGTHIYFSDVDHEFSLVEVMYGVLSGKCQGRLLEYNVLAKKLRLVASGLCGANGVQISTDGKQVIVSEMYRHRVTWIDIASGKQVRSVAMPMMPDGVTMAKNNNYFVAGSMVPRSVSKVIFGFPAVRQSLAGFLPHNILAAFVFLSSFDFQHNIVVELNDMGEVIRSLHDPNGNLTLGLAHATQLHDGRLALASFMAPHIAIVG